MFFIFSKDSLQQNIIIYMSQTFQLTFVLFIKALLMN